MHGDLKIRRRRSPRKQIDNTEQVIGSEADLRYVRASDYRCQDLRRTRKQLQSL
jgi:hypothetical protein